MSMLSQVVDRFSGSVRLAAAVALAVGTIALMPTAGGAETVTYTKSTTTVNGLKMTIFTKPTDNGGALRIASSGGRLWFSEHDTGKIVKFDPDGQAELFPIPSAGAISLALTGGPDGNVWFTVFNQGFVGRVKPTGKIKLFPTGTPDTKSN